MGTIQTRVSGKIKMEWYTNNVPKLRKILSRGAGGGGARSSQT